MNILEKLKDLGFKTIPAEYYEQGVDVWGAWYIGKVNSFHQYHIYNGKKKVRMERYSCGMAKKVAEDWANLLMNEKVHITLEGEEEQKFFDNVCLENNFTVKANEMQEKKAALGTCAYVFTVSGVPIDEDTGDVTGDGDKIKIDYVAGRSIIPLSWDNGIITECAFAVEKMVKGENYVYVQIHHLNDSGLYDIENVLYKKNNENLSDIELKDVEGFEHVPKTVHTGSEKRQFVIDRMNIANNTTQNDNRLTLFTTAMSMNSPSEKSGSWSSHRPQYPLTANRHSTATMCAFTQCRKIPRMKA